MKVQPVEFIHANSVPYMEGNVIKYISRHKSKNGAGDVRKAIHYCQLILELEYGETA
jgi:Cdc6-like AAA superfamily ATPase